MNHQPITVTAPSNSLHAAQIYTGFLGLRAKGWDVTLLDRTRDRNSPFRELPVVLAEYRGQRLVYDLWDGYQNPEGMALGLGDCDFYFKRSFSQERNGELFPEYQEKMYPLGFNYHVTCPRNPIRGQWWKEAAKPLLGRTPDRFFTPEVFEGRAERKRGEPVKILFLTQLWDDHDPSLPPEVNEERTRINQTRMTILRTLRQTYGDAFLGGLRDEALSRERAAELVVPPEITERRKYLGAVHDCDICIGTMGLHGSTGWKTGEYVAAAKAIVVEQMRYQVPGDFAEGTNCLFFTDAQGCVAAVRRLAEDEDALYRMKLANQDYYRRYLEPTALVKNTLELVDAALERD